MNKKLGGAVATRVGQLRGAIIIINEEQCFGWCQDWRISNDLIIPDVMQIYM